MNTSSATTIDEVLAAMTRILDDSIVGSQRIGYFAALYLRVTWAVKRAILAGDVFQNNERMEQLDVIFANRFLDAWQTWSQGGKPTGPWQVAFDALSRDDLMVVQHLGVAMNAHINLDLGIAAEEVMRQRGEPLEDLKTDFDMINTVLERLIGIVQVQLSELSKTFSNLERLAPRLQGKIFGKVLDGIRDGAWHFANRLDEAKTRAGRAIVYEERLLVATGLGKVVIDLPDFDHFISKVATEESANGVPFNIQIVAE